MENTLKKLKLDLPMSGQTRPFRLYVLVGCPGCGKSTWARNTFPSNAIVSRDAIRFSSIGDNDEYFAQEDKVFAKYIQQIEETMKCEGYAVADATHLSKGSRRKLYQALPHEQIEFIYYCFDTDLDICLYQNSLRSGRELVPEKALRDMHYRTVFPNYNEHNGIIEIHTIKREE